MKDHDGTESKQATAHPPTLAARVRFWALQKIARYHDRTASLRVYGATRLDSRVTDCNQGDTALEASRSRASAHKGDAGLGARLIDRVRSLYTRHEDRLIALRVFDRSRD